MKGLGLLLAAVVVVSACKKDNTEVVEMAPEPGTVPWKIQNARSAAPPEISGNATVIDRALADTAPGTQLVQGDNGWTCFPDDPGTPANDPFCVDEEASRWMAAWSARQPPRLNGMAIAYILQGGASASDTDPFKMRPDSGQEWMTDPPHIAIAMPNQRSYAGLPTARRSDGPWVRYAGTPYAFIVIPAAR